MERMAHWLYTNTAASAAINFLSKRRKRQGNLSMSQAPLTLVEKIVSKCAVKGKIGPRQFIQISPDKCMTHDNTAAVMKKFNAMRLTEVHRPEQLVFTLDHNVQDKSKENLDKYASIATFAKRYGIDHYPAGRGIGHQVMVEE
eukprot:g2322.t1